MWLAIAQHGLKIVSADSPEDALYPLAKDNITRLNMWQRIAPGDAEALLSEGVHTICTSPVWSVCLSLVDRGR
jgi:hypothetical protein